MLETPDLLFEADEVGIPYEGVPSSATVRQVGAANTYRVLGLTGSDVELVIFDVTWVDGSRDVLAQEREEGNHPKFDGLVGRLRLGVHRNGQHAYMVLGQACLDPESRRPSIRWPGLAQLEHGAGIPLEDTLRQFGASAAGTRQDLLEDEGIPGAGSPPYSRLKKPPHLPAIAFTLTRVAPVARGVTA